MNRISLQRASKSITLSTLFRDDFDEDFEEIMNEKNLVDEENGKVYSDDNNEFLEENLLLELEEDDGGALSVDILGNINISVDTFETRIIT